jgi:hypothetical protein
MTIEQAKQSEVDNPSIDVESLTDEQIKEGFKNMGNALYSDGSYTNRQCEKGLTDRSRVTAFWQTHTGRLMCYLQD